MAKKQEAKIALMRNISRCERLVAVAGDETADPRLVLHALVQCVMSDIALVNKSANLKALAPSLILDGEQAEELYKRLKKICGIGDRPAHAELKRTRRTRTAP